MASIRFSKDTLYDPANSTTLTLDPRVYNGTRSKYSTRVNVDGSGNTILTLVNKTNGRSQTFNLGTGPTSFSIDFSDNRAAVDLTGGSFTDRILGGSGYGNVINGGGSNDKLSSEGSFTTFIGGGGEFDRVTFEDSKVGIVASLGLPITGYIGFGNLNLFKDIEGIIGSSKNDVLLGNNLDNTFQGLGGRDFISGGGGTDTASYLFSSSGVNVNLTTGVNTGGDANGDTLLSIENITGSAFNDTLTGDGGNNIISGAGGADSLYGMGGDDRFYVSTTPQKIDGGAGTDTLSVLKGSPVVLTDANFTNVESVLVSTGGFVDLSGVSTGIMVGSQSGSGATDLTTIIGTSGDDRITGGLGVDDITGGAGNDTIFARSGFETFHYDQQGFGRDTIVNTDLAKDTFDVSALGSTLADLQFTAVRGGLDTQITGAHDPNPGDAIVLRGVTVAQAQTAHYTFT